MTPGQKIIIATLAVASAFVVLSLALTVTRSLNSAALLSVTQQASEPLSHTPPLSPQPETMPANACQWQAAQLLAQMGLGGTVTLSADGTLTLNLVHHLLPGQTAEDAAQLVWQAFDVVLALQDPPDTCTPLTRVNVAILAQGDQANTRIGASVSVADLSAFGAGQMDESQFIDRVTYDVEDQ